MQAEPTKHRDSLEQSRLSHTRLTDDVDVTSAVGREHPEFGACSAKIGNPERSDVILVCEGEGARRFERLRRDPVDPGRLDIERREVDESCELGGAQDDIVSVGASA